jgi:hypothetical protein
MAVWVECVRVEIFYKQAPRTLAAPAPRTVPLLWSGAMGDCNIYGITFISTYITIHLVND